MTTRGKRAQAKRRRSSGTRGRSPGGRRGRRRRRARGARSGALAVALATLLCGGVFAVQTRGPTLTRSLASLELGLPAWLDPGARLRVAELHWRHVDFVGLQKLAPRDLLRAIAPSESVALLDVDPDALCERLGRHPRVSSCRGVRVPPDRVVFDIEERVPIALSSGGQAIDAQGRRFPISGDEGEGLPRFAGDAHRAALLVQAARRAGVSLRRVAGGRDEWSFEPEGSGVRVRAAGEPDEVLRRWLRLERSGLAREHGAREVDLRFRGSAVLRDIQSDKGGREHGPS